MGKFKGISPEGIMLLSENKYNDSKEFYEANKERIRKLVLEPMYALVEDLVQDLNKIDSQMVTNPKRMIPRVKRDTRFSKNKMLYRENLWIMFMRDKNAYSNKQPCMWFEFTPEHYNYGVGFFGFDAKKAEALRNVLDSNSPEFLKAYNKIKKKQITTYIEPYKIDRSQGKDIKLKKFYNAKNLYFISENKDLQGLFDGTCEEEIREALKTFEPMYKFLLKITEKLLNNEGEINNG